jgi:hypothetical protein
MNEKTWRKKVLEWEQVLYPGNRQKLLNSWAVHRSQSQSHGRHYLLGHRLYDRHDWTVLRKDGSTVRYLGDYYYDDTLADDEKSGMPTMDDVGATRVCWWMCDQRWTVRRILESMP